jgi:hypothetical protein
MQPTSEGECNIGASTCIAGVWGGYDENNSFMPGLCEGEVWAQPESCNGLDDDCDGLIDEELDPHAKVDMVFAIDGSGSMVSVIDNLRQSIASYASDFVQAECPPGSGQQCHRFAALVFPAQDYPDCLTGPVFISLTHNAQGGSLVEVGAFQAALSNIPAVCAEEPSLDVAYELMDPNDTRIGWRTDAQPYVVLITDEPAQTWTNVTDQSVGGRAMSCQVGNCSPGDPYEIFVITTHHYYPQWTSTTLNDPGRLKDLDFFSQSVSNGIMVLQQIFQNVCMP